MTAFKISRFNFSTYGVSLGSCCKLANTSTNSFGGVNNSSFLISPSCNNSDAENAFPIVCTKNKLLTLGNISSGITFNIANIFSRLKFSFSLSE